MLCYEEKKLCKYIHSCTNGIATSATWFATCDLICDLRHCNILMMTATKSCNHSGCNHCRNILIATSIISNDVNDDSDCNCN
jgi:hypothetical protein